MSSVSQKRKATPIVPHRSPVGKFPNAASSFDELCFDLDAVILDLLMEVILFSYTSKITKRKGFFEKNENYSVANVSTRSGSED